MRGHFLVTSGLAGAALLGCVAAPVHAQDVVPQVAASRKVSEGDIIVTARRREESLQDVPIAVTAFNGEKLAQLGVSRVADLRTVTAGLNVQGSDGREDNPIYLIRGQRTTDSFLNADGAVALYLDEVLIGAGVGSNLGLFDLESVQVLKGPQGTLFGRNTTGGAILFSTAKPKDVFEAGATGGLGNYGQRLAEAFINIPLSDVVKVRAAGQYNHHDGYSTIVDGPRAGDKLQDHDELAGRLTIEIDPTDSFKSITTLYGARSNSNSPGSIIRGLSPVSFAAFVPGAADAVARQQARSFRKTGTDLYGTFNNTRVWGVYNTSTFEVSDNVLIKNIVGYRHLNFHMVDDFDASSASIITTDRIDRTREFSEELQLQGSTADTKLDYVLGIYYFNLNGFNGGTANALPGLNPFAPASGGGPLRKRSFSGYVQATWKTPVEGLSATGGFRYTEDNRRMTSKPLTLPSSPVGETCQLSQPGVTYTVDNCARTAKASFGSPTWTLSLDYQLDPLTLVYVAHRRGYRSGGFNGSAQTDIQFEPFRPETVYDMEVGLKRVSTIGDWRVRTNVAAYHQWYEDIQRNVSVFSQGLFQSVIINAASARLYGGEAEISIEPNRNLRIDLNYSYVHAKFKDFNTAGTVGGVPGVVDLSDRKFSFVPAHQFNANIHYEYPLADESAISATATYFYQSAQKFSEQYQNVAQLRTIYAAAVGALIPDNLPGFGQRGYGVFGLRLDWSNIGGTGITASLIGKNIANKRYFASGNAGYDSLGIAVATPGDPRTVFGQLSVKF